MYTIYVNNRPLRLLNEPSTAPASAPEDHLVARYSGKPRTLLNYMDMLEKGSRKVRSVDLIATDIEGLWDDFRGHFKWVPAAGGIVYNSALDAYLCIYRRGSWDLPKGKIDEGESEAEAALREVREETGLERVRLGEPLPTTYHTYRNKKGKRVLKPTYWYVMHTEEQTLTPQQEEDIEMAEWHPIEGLDDKLSDFYASLRKLLLRAQSHLRAGR